MNRIILIRNTWPECYGGGETYQLMLAEELVKNGFFPIIVSSSQKLLAEARREKIEAVEAPFIERQNWSGIYNLLLPIYFTKQFKLKIWYRKLFRKYRPSVVNIQSRDDWIAATRVAKKMRIRVLWTDHMDLRSWVLQNVNVWYKNIIGKWVLKCAGDVDKIIMISDFERRKFEEIAKPRKYRNVVTIKNGVIDNFEKYKNAKIKKNSFLYLGRIVDYKGIGELINAFMIVNEKYPNSELNFYGEGEDFEKYKKIAENNKQIHFYGRTDKPLEVVTENEIFVLPSYREGLSLSLLDAAMMGKKIIASDVDGNPEIVKNMETGLTVPPKNVQKLAEAMLYMLENPKQADMMAKNARKYYKENFDFERIFAKKMLPLYNDKEEIIK